MVYGPEDLRPYTKDRIDHILRERKETWQKMLSSGEFIVLGVEFGSIRIARSNDERRWQEICNVVRILKSDLSRDRKAEEIVRRIVEDANDHKKGTSAMKIVMQLVDSYRPDPQLDTRIKDLEPKITIPLWSPPEK